MLATVELPDGPTEVLLVPIASNEETPTVTDVQPCCTSRGSLAALDPHTGAVIWQTYMVSDEEYAAGASGASIWTVPAFDPDTNTVYVATGNNFGNDDTAITTETGDAIVSINAADGAIRWANQRWADDSWVLHYSLTEADPAHPDYDFGDGVELFELPGRRKVVAAGQKSGFMHLLDATTGEVLDQEQFMPGGGLGGFMADSAVADRVIFGNGNDWPHQIPFGGAPANKGFLVAIEVVGSYRGAQLRELWRYESAANTVMMGGPAVTNGVVFIHSSGEGKVLAFDAAGDGTPLASVAVPAGISSIAVAHGLVVAGVGDNTTIASSDAPGAIVALGL